MTTIVDAGPLVALLNRKDNHHPWTVQQVGRISPPLFTCEAVLAESHHLLSGVHDGRQRLCQLVDTGRLDLAFSYAAHTHRVHRLIAKYADRPMSFADACLLALAETLPRPTIFTLDRDFAIYRMHRNRRIPLLAPPT